MRTKVLNYRIIVTPDTQTGTDKPGFTALRPTLGIADDGSVGRFTVLSGPEWSPLPSKTVVKTTGVL